MVGFQRHLYLSIAHSYSGVTGTCSHETAASLVEGKLSFQTQVDGHMSIYVGLESSENILAFNAVHASHESKLYPDIFFYLS